MNLKIRKMKNSDLESLYKLLSDSKVMKFLEEPYNKAQTLGHRMRILGCSTAEMKMSLGC